MGLGMTAKGVKEGARQGHPIAGLIGANR